MSKDIKPVPEPIATPAPVDPLVEATAKLLTEANAEIETLKGRVAMLSTSLAFYGDRKNWAPGGKFDMRAVGFDGYYTADVALGALPKA